MSSQFNRAVAFILKWESGLVDDPQDPGGLTNFGIALNRHPELTREDILNMTPARAAEIYHGPEYWGAIQGDQLPPIIQLPMLDASVVEGPETAIRCLQRALEVTDDGVLGPITLKQATVMAGDGLVQNIGAERIVQMSKTGNWPHDRRGWARRVIAASIGALS